MLKVDSCLHQGTHFENVDFEGGGRVRRPPSPHGFQSGARMAAWADGLLILGVWSAAKVIFIDFH